MNIKNTLDENETISIPDISSDLLRTVYSSLKLTLTAILVNSAIISFILWDVVAHENILFWFFAVNIFSVVRIVIYKSFNALDPEQKIPDCWQPITFITSIISGSLWGSTAIFLFPANDIAHQVFLAFVLAGMCAGAVTTLSPFKSSSYSFILLTSIPLIISFLLESSEIVFSMAIMSLLFTGMLLITSKNLNRTIRESLTIRHQRLIDEKTIHYQANYDMLTDLPNRRLLSERLNHEIKRAGRHHHFGAVLFLDLDHFKTINDSLGHAIGDELLKQVALRIKNRIRNEDTVARLGGDEFIILIPEASDEMTTASNNAENIATEILQLFHEKFNINEHIIHTSVSIGISLFPLGETSSDTILQKADVALYEAKEAGRNTARLFYSEMQQVVNNRRAIEKDLHQAIINNEFELNYQPQVDINQNIIAYEALLRWNHPDKGLISPETFINIAEKCGLIVPIGEWVLKTACQQFANIIEINKNLRICINVSPRQFNDHLFIEKIQTVISETGINPNNIQLEITEGMVLKDIDETIDKMKSLKLIGLSFAIDDFGTGYSSLTYLKKLPIDILKIDKSFVLESVHNSNDAAIVKTIIAMAQNMDIDILAEGVETQQIMDFLKEIDCEMFQGYLFGRPVKIDQITSFYDTYKQKNLP
ncbi:diguanylate cyclase/phosphodiesterase (GGDEF & EAL domains) with PAS/PAC sensor(s) [hydrothermal vent metagenome]|uniref:Diguanylate cyclase/phosphodiesterase (GGDEF & EAL domains) with PAS/PAC sensor(S) n=1 Tax=hydrothermal vent metagenome TaxID=652676 RepID=A0A3B0WF84_9ZZZZ